MISWTVPDNPHVSVDFSNLHKPERIIMIHMTSDGSNHFGGFPVKVTTVGKSIGETVTSCQ
jgi:hypothetical protein